VTGSGALAADMLAECARDGQSARVVADDAAADELRAGIRRRARADGVRIRTARMDDTVVAVRMDAAIWDDDTATMRRKLAPRERR
jgi:hypothetical protein